MTGPKGTGSWSGDRRSFPASTRRRIIARDRECQLGYTGCTGGADQADHIVNHAEATRRGWTLDQINDPDNGQAACDFCHHLKTQAEAAAGRARARADRQSRSRRNRRKLDHPGIVGPDEIGRAHV